jgi:FkbM family methyltransferase
MNNDISTKPVNTENKDTSPILVSDKLASFVYNLLLKTIKLDGYKYMPNLWQRVWEKSCNTFSDPVSTVIHGYEVILNYGYTYPVFARRFNSYNNPLIELVHQAFTTKNSPIVFIDIGAAIGDTVLLIYSNCPNAIGQFYCIDGDTEFFRYLQHNLGHFNEGNLILSMLSEKETSEKELVRTHRGTASAQGEVEVLARPLDSVMREANLTDVDAIKIDVDGLDGKVLQGSKYILEKYKPAVIFEWHPILCQRTGNNWLEHFNVLINCGYDRFVWFNKFGEFSHFMVKFDETSINYIADLCLRGEFSYDWHYDIIAIHQESSISPVALAEMSFAKARKSKF